MSEPTMSFIRPAQDPWQVFTATAGESGAPTVATIAAHSLLTLEQWQAVRGSLPDDLPVGVTLPNTADVEALVEDLPRLALIVLHFPKWVDGRAYSQARTLRARLRYRGQIRATGDVVVDMLPLLERTGFDAVQLREGQSEAGARNALQFVTAHYQGDVHQTRPRFSRVLA